MEPNEHPFIPVSKETTCDNVIKQEQHQDEVLPQPIMTITVDAVDEKPCDHAKATSGGKATGEPKLNKAQQRKEANITSHAEKNERPEAHLWKKSGEQKTELPRTGEQTENQPLFRDPERSGFQRDGEKNRETDVQDELKREFQQAKRDLAEQRELTKHVERERDELSKTIVELHGEIAELTAQLETSRLNEEILAERGKRTPTIDKEIAFVKWCTRNGSERASIPAGSEWFTTEFHQTYKNATFERIRNLHFKMFRPLVNWHQLQVEENHQEPSMDDLQTQAKQLMPPDGKNSDADFTDPEGTGRYYWLKFRRFLKDPNY